MSWTCHPELLATPVPRYTSYPTARVANGSSALRSCLAVLAAASLAPTPAAPASAGIWVPVCGNHPPMRIPLPASGKGDMPQGCHAGCAAMPEKKKRLASG
jgi:hypothetical protein